MLLNIKTRQLYLKELGFYKGEIDEIEGKLTKQAYLKLQLKYFNKRIIISLPIKQVEKHFLIYFIPLLDKIIKQIN